MMTTIVLETIANSLLQLDPIVIEKLSPHVGKSLLLCLTDLNIELVFIFRKDKIQIARFFEPEPTATIKTTLFSLLQLQLNSNSVINQNITIDGDVELAQQCYQILKTIHFDGEEYLSYFTGDIVAHQIFNKLRSFLRRQQYQFTSLKNNFIEYLQEEKMVLANSEAIEDFYEEINVLRNAVERLAARYERLTQHPIMLATNENALSHLQEEVR